MDDVVGCFGRTQKIIVTLPLSFLPLLLSYFVCVYLHSVKAEWQLWAWKTEAASWTFYTDQHLHTPHKPGM